MVHIAQIRRHGPVRAGLTALTALAVAGATLATPAGAAVGPPGPINPETGFPSFYTDGGGTAALQLCLDGTLACGEAQASDLTPPGGEAFYYSAVADIPVAGGDPVSVEFALEAAFAGSGNGQQIVFDRIRVRGELPPGNYTLQHPFGEDSLESVEQAGFNLNVTDDVGCADVPCDFTRAQGGRITNFLRSTTAPIGYLGDGELTTVTGATASDVAGPRNLVRLIGPGGGLVGESNEFAVLGKLIAGPSAALSSRSVDFGNTTSASQPVTVTNIGTQNLTFTGAPAGLAGGFAVGANGCTGSLIPGGSCSVTVSFAASALTPDARATLSLPSNAPTGPVNVALHATALPAARVAGGPLSFPAQKVGTTSAARAVTVVNTGVVTMPALTASTTGPFSAPTGCAAPVAPGASCTIATSYLPTAHGAQAGTLTVNHPVAANAPSSTVGLSGSGTTAAATVNRASISFGRAKVRTTTSQRIVRLSNTGDAAMVIRKATTTGPFRVGTSDCPASLAPGDFCHVGVRFRPTALGEQAGSLRLNHDGVSGPRAIGLQGTGSRAGAPTAPRRVVAHAGRPGGRATASVTWTSPRSTGGAGISAYRVSIRQVGSTRVVTRVVRARARSLTATGLVRGARYRFAVRAVNGVGPSVASPLTSAVRAR